MSDEGREHYDILGTPFPPYVVGDDARLRWNESLLLSCGLSFANAPEAHPDRSFIWMTTRTLYKDETFASISREQFEAELAEARELGVVPHDVTHEEFIDARAREAFAAARPFVIEAAGWEGRYIQGGMTSATELYLEAADLDLRGTGTIDASQLAALAALGFEREEVNFAQRRRVAGADEAATVAATIGAKVF